MRLAFQMVALPTRRGWHEMDHHAQACSGSDRNEGAAKQVGRGARSMTGTITVHCPHLTSRARLCDQLMTISPGASRTKKWWRAQLARKERATTA